MIESALVSWEGSAPKACGKGVDVYSGINLVKIHSIRRIPPENFKKAVSNTLLTALQGRLGKDFSLMKEIKILNIESEFYGDNEINALK